MDNKEKVKYGGLRIGVFGVSVIVTVAICVFLLANSETSGAMLGVLYSFITSKIGWAFSIYGVFALAFLIWLAFSKYGKIKLGAPGEKPKYTKLQWIARMFCTGPGATLIHWSIAEPIQYSAGPPYGLEAGSVEASEFAATYGMFHWGPIAWAVMVIPAVPLAYYFLVKRKPNVTMATPFEGRLSQTWINVIDVLVLFTCIANACTSLGLASPTVSALISSVFNVEQTTMLNIVVLIIFIGIFSTSAGLGLDRGIKRLSMINLYLVYGLLAVVLLLGPSIFIMNNFSNSLSIMINEFFRMALYTDPYGKSGFPQDWTIFYWAWWISAVPYTAIFIAKISKGRTIREVAIGGFLWGSIGDFVSFAILGGSAMYSMTEQGNDLVSIYNDSGAAAAVAKVITDLPIGTVLAPCFIVSMFIFSSTTYDSCTYVMANVAHKGKTINDEAPTWQRILWAALVALAAATLLWLGGLKPLQSFAVVVAIPMTVICIATVVVFLKDIKKDYIANFGETKDVLEMKVPEESAEPEAVAE